MFYLMAYSFMVLGSFGVIYVLGRKRRRAPRTAGLHGRSPGGNRHWRFC